MESNEALSQCMTDPLHKCLAAAVERLDPRAPADARRRTADFSVLCGHLPAAIRGLSDGGQHFTGNIRHFQQTVEDAVAAAFFFVRDEDSAVRVAAGNCLLNVHFALCDLQRRVEGLKRPRGDGEQQDWWMTVSPENLLVGIWRSMCSMLAYPGSADRITGLELMRRTASAGLVVALPLLVSCFAEESLQDSETKRRHKRRMGLEDAVRQQKQQELAAAVQGKTAMGQGSSASGGIKQHADTGINLTSGSRGAGRIQKSFGSVASSPNDGQQEGEDGSLVDAVNDPCAGCMVYVFEDELAAVRMEAARTAVVLASAVEGHDAGRRAGTQSMSDEAQGFLAATLEFILDLMHDEDDAVRVEALRCLRRLPKRPAVQQRTAKLVADVCLRDRGMAVRHGGCFTLGCLSYDTAETFNVVENILRVHAGQSPPDRLVATVAVEQLQAGRRTAGGSNTTDAAVQHRLPVISGSGSAFTDLLRRVFDRAARPNDGGSPQTGFPRLQHAINSMSSSAPPDAIIRELRATTRYAPRLANKAVFAVLAEASLSSPSSATLGLLTEVASLVSVREVIVNGISFPRSAAFRRPGGPCLRYPFDATVVVALTTARAVPDLAQLTVVLTAGSSPPVETVCLADCAPSLHVKRTGSSVIRFTLRLPAELAAGEVTVCTATDHGNTVPLHVAPIPIVVDNAVLKT